MIENEDGQMIWVAGGLEMGVLTEAQGEGQEGASLFQTTSSSAAAKAVRITSDMELNKKDNQMLPTTIINSQFLEPGVEVSNVYLNGDTLIQDDRGPSTLTSLELDDGSSGSILVLTDPSQLAALQQLAVAGDGTDGTVEDSVKVIGLEDFTAVAESTITEGFKEDVHMKQDISCDSKNIIIVREVEQKIKSESC